MAYNPPKSGLSPFAEWMSSMRMGATGSLLNDGVPLYYSDQATYDRWRGKKAAYDREYKANKKANARKEALKKAFKDPNNKNKNFPSPKPSPKASPQPSPKNSPRPSPTNIPKSITVPIPAKRDSKIVYGH